MFVDLVGSTTLSARLDPEDLRELLAAYHGIVADVVKAQEGHVAQYLGDGALIYFGYPVSHEDDGERAIKTGLSLLERTRGLTVHGAEISIRIGLATGIVVVGDKAVGSDAAHEPRIMGETPNIAARLQGLAKPGEIVIAGSTRQLIGTLFAYEDLGLVELKGVPRPMAAWKVLHATGVEDRFRALRSDATPFIGREEELELLLRRWRQLPEEGGKAVFIAGEAGLGKSRLLAAAREMIAADDPQVVTYFCSQNFTNTALYPVIRHIERACRFGSSDTQDRQLQYLVAFLGELYSPEALSLLANLLSIHVDGADSVGHLSPAERRKATFDLLIQHLTRLAEARPLAVVFEDIHWADASTLDFLNVLIDSIELRPILVLATYRPGFQPARASHARVTGITLAPLTTRERHRLIEAVAGHGSLSQELIDEIAERTDGVPLFAEELTKATVDAGATVVQEAARGSHIPATLHASLMARLDWLGPIARQVAQTGAVIGREFSHVLLRAIWSGRAREINKSLKQLEAAGLIFARGVGRQATYSFKHALVQDAAYSTLLRGQKKALHGAVAKHLSERANAEKVAELIARHFREAQHYQQAAEWRLRAAEASNRGSAYREASQNLQEGLADAALLPNSSERKGLELKINLALSFPYNAIYGMTSLQATEVLERAEALLLDLGKPRHPSLLYQRFLVSLMKAEYKRARPFACELEEMMKHEVMGLRASCLRILADFYSGGDLSALKTEMQEVFEKICQYGPEIDGLRFAYTYDFKTAVVPALSNLLLFTGHYDQAVRICDFGRTRAQALKHSMSLCSVLCFEVTAHDFRGDLARMQERCNEVWEVASRDGLAFWRPQISQWRGLILAMTGNIDGGLALFDEAHSTLERMNVKFSDTYFLSLRARILDLGGRGDEALTTVDKAIAMAESSDEKLELANLRRLRGQYLLQYRGAEAEAEMEFQSALAVARKQKALSYELRAAHALANLMRIRGDEVGALDLLEPVFNRFTEGFDTADLVSARETIDELKSGLGPAQQFAAGAL